MLTPREIFLKHIAQTSESPLQLEVEKAEGVYLFNGKGEKYIDLISGVSVSNVGHCHPKVIDAVTQQANRYMHLMVYGEYIQYPQVKLAQRITDLLPKTLNSVYFVNSGSEAVEGAMKLAKRFTGRPELIAMNNAYHGSTQGAMSLMGNEDQIRAYRPLLTGIQHIQFNDPDQLDRITQKTACVMVEPVQGEGGIIEPTDNYLHALKERCQKTGALLVFDEIQTGMGRTGKMFAFEKYGVVPDILLLAKAFGGGMPLGAFIADRNIMRCITHSPPLGHITTFGGHPVSCAAALASLDVLLDEKLIEGVDRKENLFRSLLSKNPKVKSWRSSGLFIAVELGSFEKVQKCIRIALEKGVILDWFLFCNTAFRIAPPLTISEDEIEEVCSILSQVLDQL
jgi:acetylornithine/succinyldiaminopimelate/putrescine aminotransferase